MLLMVARLILNNGNTFPTATLLTAVLSYHVQLTNAILNIKQTINDALQQSSKWNIYQQR